MVCVGHHLWPTECGAQQSEGPIPMESPTSSLFAELRLGAGQRQQANHVARRDGSGSFSMDDDGWCSDRQKSHGAATTVAGPVRLAEAARSLFHQFSRTKRKTRLPRFHSCGNGGHGPPTSTLPKCTEVSELCQPRLREPRWRSAHVAKRQS